MIQERIYELEEKVVKTCKSEKLFFSWETDSFPIVAKIKNDPQKVNQQIMNFDNVPAEKEDGELWFIFDEELQIKIDDDFVISDDIFSKLKRLFSKLHYEYLQLFFKETKELPDND